MSNALSPYETLIQQVRQEREKNLLKAERGWLTLAGLFHLHEGENTFGSGAENDVVLPTTAPAQAGVFVLKNGAVSIQAKAGLQMLCNGGHLPAGALADDQAEAPDFLTIGKITLVAIRRGSQHYIRMWNADNPARKEFTGLRFFPVNSDLCINVEFTPYNPPLPITITDVLGNEHEVPHIGYVTFEWGGQECCLQAIGDQKSLYFSFRDPTNGDTTYGGGRELEADLPYEILNGKVWPWSYADHENRYLNVAETLRHAICANPHLKVHVANGYYDLATPYFATHYTFNRLGLEPELRSNISMSYYEAGHMMYVHMPSLKKLKEELAKFIRSAV
jgi:uncharacterized protein (DUF1684 family)